jgi:ADP-dependent NAD(P)H-hydrate dehydratase / NAD(P)H-hydrate epimerase
MIAVTAKQMREIDRLTIEKFGVASLTLMESAGQGVARMILQTFASAASKGILVVAGKGNNGGDGLVVARLLQKQKIFCNVVLLAKRQELSPDAAHNLQAFLDIKGKVIEIESSTLSLLHKQIADAEILVDAILGTGTKNEITGLYAAAIAAMNDSGKPIVAIDIPSGLDTDRGTPLGVCVKAAMTVALGYAKLGEVIYPGLSFVGDLTVVDIGLADEAVASVGSAAEVLERDNVRPLVPVRQPDTHKGTYGHALVIAGSRGKTGAAILACRAAMRSGAGLVTLAAACPLNDIFAGALTEVMTEPLPADSVDEIVSLDDDQWRRLLAHRSVLLFGPGIGVSSSTRNNLRWLLGNLAIPWVIDADGLNNLALDLERLRHARIAPILTPHPGEMARLLGTDTAAVNGDRIGVARRFAQLHHCHLVLKGARTVIATRTGEVFINSTGNAGMASGGMGDVLAGILTALLAQGLSPINAMKLGVYLHGFIGDQVAAERGQIGLIASDIIEALPTGLRSLSAHP